MIDSKWPWSNNFSFIASKISEGIGINKNDEMKKKGNARYNKLKGTLRCCLLYQGLDIYDTLFVGLIDVLPEYTTKLMTLLRLKDLALFDARS